MVVATDKAFVAVYYALDAAYDNNHDKILREYLSNANPFQFKDGRSADPATYSEFRSFYEGRIGSQSNQENSLSCVHEYLRYQNPNFLEIFDTIVNKETWVEALKSIN